MITQSRLALFGVFVVLLYSCNLQKKNESTLSIKLSKGVDSLVHDTTGINYIVDSLKNQERKATSDTDAINILNDLAQFYDKYGLKFSGEALKNAQRINYKYGITDATCRKGIYFFKKNLFDSAHVYFNKGLALAKQYNETKLIALVLFFQGQEYSLHGDYIKALGLYNRCDSVALKTGDKSRRASCLALKGDVYRHTSKFDSALIYYNQSIKLAEETGMKSQLAFTLSSTGDVYRLQNNYVTALQYYYRSLELAKLLRSKLRLASCYAVIGDIFHLKHDTAKEMFYFNQAVPLSREIGDKSNLAFCLSIIGDTYLEQKQYDKALANYTEAMEISKQIKSKNYISFLLSAMANVYMAKGDYIKVQDYYSQSLAMVKELGDKNYESMAEQGLGELYLKKNDLAKANEYAAQSLAAAKAANSLQNIANASDLSYRVAQRMGDYKHSLDMHLQYSAMHDSLNNEEIQKQEVQKEIQYEYDKKESELKAAEVKRDLIAQGESKRQKIAILLAAIVAFSAGVIAILIFISLRTTRKRKLIIEEQKILVEQTNKEMFDSITYAKHLQDAILPQLKEVSKLLPESFVLYLPKDIVAGDFYWIERVAVPQPNLPLEGKVQGRSIHESTPQGVDLGGALILIAAADCTGHGVPGAMVSVVCSNSLNSAVREFNISEPGKVLDKTRDLLLETFKKSASEINDGMDISLAAISCQPTANSYKIQWSGANNPLWYVQDNKLIEITADKQPIGKHSRTTPFTTHTINLKKGDMLYLFTDGYADQFGGEKGKKFKYKQLQEKLLALSSQSLVVQKQELQGIFEAWRGKLEQVDDVLIIGIRV
jgi:tetratricopeptide (TPR) repeat protein